MSKRQRSELFRAFDRWAADVKGWSPKTRETYYRRCIAAELWLAMHRGVSICWAQPKDLQAYLFQTKPNPRVRNQIRKALVGFGEYLIDSGYSEVNPALALIVRTSGGSGPPPCI
jgi:hypothetical protein